MKNNMRWIFVAFFLLPMTHDKAMEMPTRSIFIDAAFPSRESTPSLPGGIPSRETPCGYTPSYQQSVLTEAAISDPRTWETLPTLSTYDDTRDTQSPTNLHACAEHGDTVTLARILAGRPLSTIMNAQRDDILNPVALAAQKGHAHFVQACIEYAKTTDDPTGLLTIEINATPEQSPLIIAARNGQVEVVRLMLKLLKQYQNALPQVLRIVPAGTNPMPPDIDRKLANGFLAATHRECHDCVRAFIDAGISPNIQNSSGQTPLMIAARAGNKALMRILLNNGALPDINDHQRQNITDCAHRDIVWFCWKILALHRIKQCCPLCLRSTNKHGTIEP